MNRPVLTASVTDHQESGEDALQSQIPYRLIFDSNPIPMWMLDATTFRFLAVNDAATSQYGYSNEEFLRMSISDIWPDARILDVAENVAKSCSGTHSPGVRK